MAAAHADPPWVAVDGAEVTVGQLAGFPGFVGASLWVPDRALGRVHVVDGPALAHGADPVSVIWVEGRAIVVDRQRAALPASGAYEGAPARVVAHEPDGTVAWATDAR